MKSSFIIFQTSTSFNERPPISYKIREYFETFITENVLITKNIVVNSKWKIILDICFTRTGPKVLFKGIALGKGARTVSAENSKIYSAVILTEPIYEASNPLLKTIELMYEALKLFLTSTYKKVTPEFMDELLKQVDLSYLLSLPYPAPFVEQRYLLDEQKYKENADGSVSKIMVQPLPNWVGFKGTL